MRITKQLINFMEIIEVYLIYLIALISPILFILSITECSIRYSVNNAITPDILFFSPSLSISLSLSALV